MKCGDNMRKQLNSSLMRIIAVLLIMLQLFAFGVSARDNVLSLYKYHAEDSIPFNVSNMFPGDSVTQKYNVKVSYEGHIKVYFTADVRAGSEKLAEVLKCKVFFKNNGKVLYDGLMKDMPHIEHNLSGSRSTEFLQYEISAYLDTSVGNEYKNKQLTADFDWWAYTSNEGYPGEEGGTGGGGGGGGIIAPMKPDVPPSGGDDPNAPSGGTDEPGSPSGGKDDPTGQPVGEGSGDTPAGGKGDPSGQEGGEGSADSPAGGKGDLSGQDGQQIGADGRPTGQLTKPPKTGDIENPGLWIALICISLFIIIILLIILLGGKKNKKEQENNPLIKKLTICIIVIVILAICLCITTFALVYSIVSVNENIFRTGTVEINLNDGKPIIREDEFLFEPGMTVVKDFFIENESSDAVYYKIYFDKIAGGLARVMDVKIFDKQTGERLYSGKAENLLRENCQSAELAFNETRTLTAEFHYPEVSGNDTQNLSMSFDLCAVATQKRNNVNREFN